MLQIERSRPQQAVAPNTSVSLDSCPLVPQPIDSDPPAARPRPRHGARTTQLYAGLLALWALGGAAEANTQRPIVAVFTVEAQGVELSARTLDRLSNYLAGSLVATGHYQVVPRDQLKLRLTAQKADSYRSCYERSCQIEIGKELAAQLSLATQVIKLGSKCAVTATLFDLRKAAAASAATRRGGCSEDEIVASLEKTVAGLVPKGASRAGASDSFGGLGVRGSSPATERQTDPAVSGGGRSRVLGILRSGKLAKLSRQGQRLVAVDILSAPPFASVFLDSRRLCTTPCRTNLPVGDYQLQLERRNHQSQSHRIQVRQRQIFDYTLELSASGRELVADRTELVSFDGLLGTIVGSYGGFVGGGQLKLPVIKNGRFFWSTLELGAAGGAPGAVGFALTRLGYQRSYGALGQHQLRIGLGIGIGVIAVDESSYDANGAALRSSAESAFLALAPGVEYHYSTKSLLHLAAGVQAVVPSVNDLSRYHTAILATLSIGLQMPASSY